MTGFKWAVGLLLLGAALWAMNEVAESRIADAQRKADSLARAESISTARADSLADARSAVEDSLSRLDSAYAVLSGRVDRLDRRNRVLTDSLSELSVQLGEEAQAAGQRFDSVWTALATESPSPKLDTLRAIHEAQVSTLQSQVRAEADRADSNRQVIERQRQQIAMLESRVALRDTVIQNLHGEVDALRESLEKARERAQHWKGQADPGLFVSIGRNLEKYAGALVIGAVGGALLAR